MIIDQATIAIVANYFHLEPLLTSFLFFLNLALLHFQYTSLAYRFTISRIFVWHWVIRNFKLPVTISTPESLHILSRSCIYFNIIMQNKILSIESLFQPFMLLFKYNSDIQIMIMIVQIIVPTACVHSFIILSFHLSCIF